jgi:endonuclease/exonuclease/phosphatase family metal-dependent hydrolase/MFS family permease
MKSIKNFIKENYSDLILLSILFLFFLQLISDLVESIYVLDLLHTSLDEKVAGIIFLLTPIILIFFKKGVSKKFLYILAEIIIVLRVINPFMDTGSKIITAGIGVGCFMIFFPAYLSHIRKDEEEQKSINLGVGFAIAVVLSIMFRSLLSTVDISSYKGFQVIGWILATIATIMIIGRFNIETPPESNQIRSPSDETINTKRNPKKIITLVLGLISIIIIIYFAFSSPTVISRWTEGNYIAITIITAAMISLFAIIMIIKPELINKLKPSMIWLWNGLFVLSVILTIVVNIISFPTSPSSQPVIVYSPTWPYYIPLYLMLLLLPIIFFDFIFLSRELINRNPSLPKIARNFTLGGFFFIILILMFIFTNVWGYVDVVSLIFRNLFWLPFLILGICIAGPMLRIQKKNLQFSRTIIEIKDKIPKLSVLASLFLLTIIGLLINSASPVPPSNGSISTLTVFTYNIQQGANETGDINYDSQIALIKEVNPDIIGLQECDSARISLGNVDVVRYFADRLTGFNYYSYYGPKTVTGTYGVAVLSKYPIINALSFFTYSDVDEIGTAEVQIRVGSEIFNVYINHPAGSHEAQLTHITTLINRIGSKNRVISMGDFNFRQDSEYYNISVAVLQDAWLTIFPSAVGYGLNMSDRIDHIFLSSDITVSDARYNIDPQSDHPAHWAEITW